MMPAYKGKRMPLLHRQTQTRHCWMPLLPRVMLLRHWQMLPLLKQMPHKLSQMLLRHKQMRIKRCWMPLPLPPLPDQRFPTLLTLPLEIFLLEQGQAPTLLLRWVLTVKSLLPILLVPRE
jgi:hypothetical protein